MPVPISSLIFVASTLGIEKTEKLGYDGTFFLLLFEDRSPGVAKKDNSVSSSLEKMIVYVSQRKKNLENVSHGLNQIPENHM